MLITSKKEAILNLDFFKKFDNSLKKGNEKGCKNSFKELINDISKNISKTISTLIDLSMKDELGLGYTFVDLEQNAENIFRDIFIPISEIFENYYFKEDEYGHLILERNIELNHILDGLILKKGSIFELVNLEGDIDDCNTEPRNFYSFSGVMISPEGEEYNIYSDGYPIIEFYPCTDSKEVINEYKIIIEEKQL